MGYLPTSWVDTVTGVNATRLNNMETALFFIDLDSDGIKDNQNTVFGRVDGRITTITSYHPDGLTVKGLSTFNRTDGVLTSIVTQLYDPAGILKKTITTTLTKIDGRISNIGRSVVYE